MALKDERSPKYAFPGAGTSLLKSPRKSLLYTFLSGLAAGSLLARCWLAARCCTAAVPLTAASACVCCCLLMLAAACCCLLLPAAACCLLLPATGAAAGGCCCCCGAAVVLLQSNTFQSKKQLLLLLVLLLLLLLLLLQHSSETRVKWVKCLIPQRAPPCVCRGRRIPSSWKGLEWPPGSPGQSSKI